jgi:hypothetical protein
MTEIILIDMTDILEVQEKLKNQFPDYYMGDIKIVITRCNNPGNQLDLAHYTAKWCSFNNNWVVTWERDLQYYEYNLLDPPLPTILGYYTKVNNVWTFTKE